MLTAAQNPCARFLLCCLKCCFWCLEKFIKFLNRNAYIMVRLKLAAARCSTNICFYWASNRRLFSLQIAIYGKNFCVSAKNAFMLLMRNIVR